MKNKKIMIIISLMLVGTISTSTYAESLFKIGTSQNVYYNQPRPLIGTVRARSIGDIVTVVINESTKTSDEVKLNASVSSTNTDNFSTILNSIIPTSWLKIFKNGQIPSVNNYGGGSASTNDNVLTRTSTFADTITTQVVQILPNGNFVIQGRKSAINADERLDLVLSGIVDPRLINSIGQISSNLVANLQIAAVGKGTVSNADKEGTMNKVTKYLY